ncbi:HAD domain-containing protein [Kribbella sp. NPDC058245]|uniref:HAD domain-containing protein n=1 Tax=Kribbella sp. NPDC058245 TaxID=3346399 RepID=UPI0036E91984
MSSRPLLFLDVDGPLIPFGGTDYPTYSQSTDGNPLLGRINPALGPRLSALGCALVWATTWTTGANDHLSPRLGLPDLPVVDWPDPSDDDPIGIHWKTPTLVAWAAGRPFIWLDDEVTDRDRSWVRANHAAPALLHTVDPTRGLTDEDFAVLSRWL